jgi:hypothetical protein
VAAVRLCGRLRLCFVIILRSWKLLLLDEPPGLDPAAPIGGLLLFLLPK